MRAAKGVLKRIDDGLVMELKIIKCDGALKDLVGQLKEFNATNL